MDDNAPIRLHSFQASQQVTAEIYGLLLSLHLFLTQCHLCLGGALG